MNHGIIPIFLRGWVIKTGRQNLVGHCAQLTNKSVFFFKSVQILCLGLIELACLNGPIEWLWPITSKLYIVNADFRTHPVSLPFSCWSSNSPFDLIDIMVYAWVNVMQNPIFQRHEFLTPSLIFTGSPVSQSSFSEKLLLFGIWHNDYPVFCFFPNSNRSSYPHISPLTQLKMGYIQRYPDINITSKQLL